MTAYEPVTPGELLRYHGPRRGALVLRDVLHSELGPNLVPRPIGIYNRRKVAGSATWSLHAVGRALDVPVADPHVGRLLALHAVDRAAIVGVCEVIGPTGRWTPDSGHTDHGAGQHQDHVHMGLTRGFADGTADPVTWRFLLTLAWRG